MGKSAFGTVGIRFAVAGMICLALVSSWIREGGEAFLGKAPLAAGWPATFKSSECNSLFGRVLTASSGKLAPRYGLRDCCYLYISEILLCQWYLGISRACEKGDVLSGHDFLP